MNQELAEVGLEPPSLKRLVRYRIYNKRLGLGMRNNKNPNYIPCAAYSEKKNRHPPDHGWFHNTVTSIYVQLKKNKN